MRQSEISLNGQGGPPTEEVPVGPIEFMASRSFDERKTRTMNIYLEIVLRDETEE
jgi:hypothetical protein